MTEDQCRTLVRMAVEAFRPPRWTEDTTNVYVMTLVDLDHDLAAAAIMQAIQHEQYMPTVAAIRSRCAPRSMAAADAWAEVCDQIRWVGYVGTPEWSNPLIGRVVAGMGGWQAICMSENQIADRAHFMRMWEESAERADREATTSPAVRDALDAARAREVDELFTPRKELE